MTEIIIRPLTKEDKIKDAEVVSESKVDIVSIAKDARREAYVRISDPVYMQWQRGLKTEQDWLDAVAQVEADYPIPGEGDE